MSYEIIVGHAIWQVLRETKGCVPHQVDVYGPSESGKTTLDMQMTTRGEIRALGDEERTHHKKNWLGREKMPHQTKKRIKSDGFTSRTVVSRDIGGHKEYHSMWLRDMIQRKVKTVVVVVDHRHLANPRDTSNQVALGYLVRSLSQNKIPKGLGLRARLRAKKYAPTRILILANKADEWMSDEDYAQWQRGFIARHKIFDVFRDDMYQLQKMHIPVHLDAISARYSWNVEQAILKGISL